MTDAEQPLFGLVYSARSTLLFVADQRTMKQPEHAEAEHCLHAAVLAIDEALDALVAAELAHKILDEESG